MNNTDCDKITELLPAYIAGQLGVKTRMSVAAHLASCPNCRSEAAEVYKLNKAFETVFPDPDSEFMRSAFKLLDCGNTPEKPRNAFEALAAAVGTAKSTLTLTRKTLALIKL